jgi:hypothetical protein
VALSFLIGICNFRLGHWWSSGVDPKRRVGATPQPSHLAWFRAFLSRVFPVQAHLVAELVARFPGTAHRDWYLSDGGHFENTGAYELLRRRLAFIAVCDNGHDPERSFGDLGNLVRKARVDLGAHVEFLDRTELGRVAPGAASVLGALEDLGFGEGRRPVRYAALARVTYEGSRESSWMLWLRPAVLGDEPVDLLNYRAMNPAFPEQPTSDQFFDEAQWESYRRLGELIGTAVFSGLRPPATGSPADGWSPVEASGRLTPASP